MVTDDEMREFENRLPTDEVLPDGWSQQRYVDTFMSVCTLAMRLVEGARDSLDAHEREWVVRRVGGMPADPFHEEVMRGFGAVNEWVAIDRTGEWNQTLADVATAQRHRLDPPARAFAPEIAASHLDLWEFVAKETPVGPMRLENLRDGRVVDVHGVLFDDTSSPGDVVLARLVEHGGLCLSTSLFRIDCELADELMARLQLRFDDSEYDAWSQFMKSVGWEPCLEAVFTTLRRTSGQDELAERPWYATGVDRRTALELHAAFGDLEVAYQDLCDADPELAAGFQGLDATGRVFRVEPARGGGICMLRIFEDEPQEALPFTSGTGWNEHLLVDRVPGPCVCEEDVKYLRATGLRPALHGVVRPLDYGEGHLRWIDPPQLDAVLTAITWAKRTMRTFARSEVA